MKEIVLKNIVYNFYPKNINAISADYLTSIEYKNLTKVINFFEKTDLSREQLNLENRLRKLSNNKFINNTIFSNLDRCYNYQLLELLDNKVLSICINISILVPYYFIYVLELEINSTDYSWKGLPTRNKVLEKVKYKEDIEKISNLIEHELKYTKFPNDIINKKIEKISFQDIKEGDFSFFNAFFANEFTIRT